MFSRVLIFATAILAVTSQNHYSHEHATSSQSVIRHDALHSNHGYQPGISYHSPVLIQSLPNNYYRQAVHLPITHSAGVTHAFPLTQSAGITHALPLTHTGGITHATPLTDTAAITHAVPFTHTGGIAHAEPLTHTAAITHAVPLTHTAAYTHGAPLTDAADIAHAVPLTHTAAYTHGTPLTDAADIAHAVPLTHTAAYTHAAPVTRLVPYHTASITHATPVSYHVPNSHHQSHVHESHIAPVIPHAAPYYAVPAVTLQHTPAHYNQHQYASGHQEYYTHPRYQFEYTVNDPHTGDIKSQREERDGDVVNGVYSLHEADGSVRTVHYNSNGHSGFNADVHLSQPSTHIQPVSHYAPHYNHH